jgi:hypothetical protein
MATKIVHSSDLFYVNRVGFIKKCTVFKWLLSIILILSTFTYYHFIDLDKSKFDSMIVTSENIVKEDIKQETLLDRVEDYIHSKNPNLDDDTKSALAKTIVDESISKKISLELILGLVYVESKFDQYAVSSSGALGFFQVKPGVHRDKIAMQDNRDLYDPVTNTKIGLKVLGDCMRIHSGIRKSLSCYNGSGNDESESYANKVIKSAPKHV